MGNWRFSFSDVGVRYLCNHKQKQTKIKMVTKLDGSEASMLPVLILNSNVLIGQKDKKNIVNIQEFTVGRGIADLFVVEKDKSKLSARKKLCSTALTDSRQITCHSHSHDFKSTNVIKRSVAVEAKVRDWRRGLKQALRYKSFADKSYLAVYSSHIHAPLENIEVFKALNVGLVGVSDTGITIYFMPNDNFIDESKAILASERAYSVIDDAQDSFVVRNQFIAGGVPA